jgi:branched-subunit amino acid aminotransferase/4-amino-4-deoxychorismate lyase
VGIVIPIFETVLVDDGRIRLRARHLERLARCGASPAQVAAVDACFADALLLTDPPCLLRVDVDDEGVRPSTRPPRPATPVELMIDRSYDPAREERLLKTADRAWADAAEAAAGGEALLVSTTGLIGETTRASVLLHAADGGFAMPDLRGILPGVTRAWALEQTDATERDVQLDELRSAHGAALLTAGRGVVPIAAVEGIALARSAALDELACSWRELP